MLSQKHRISRRSFDDVFSRGKFFNGEHLSGKIATLDEGLATRFAVVSQKKLTKRAVDRNRLRRRVYSAIYPLSGGIKPGFAIIVFAKPSLLTLNFSDLKTVLANLLKHHHLIND